MGEPQAKTLTMLSETVNASGGIHGKKIDLLIRDSQGIPEKAVQYAKELINENVLAIIGPTTSAETMSIKALCENSKTMLISCASDQGIVEPVAKYVFKTPPNSAYAIEKICRTLQEKGISSIALLTDTSGYGNYGKTNFEKMSPRYGISVIAVEQYAQLETDFSGLLSRLSNKKYQAIVNWANGPTQSLITRQIRKAGIDKPLIQSSTFGNLYYLYAAGPSAEGVIFPGDLLNVAEMIPDGYPQKTVIMEYRSMYTKKYNEETSMFGGLAADAFNILLNVIKNHDLDGESLRVGIENLKGFAGIEGIYSFSGTDHNGLVADAFSMLTVSNGKFMLYGKESETARVNLNETYRPVVAVMDFNFENLAPGEGNLVVDALTSSLVKSNRYFVLEKNQRENLIKEMEVSLSDLVDTASQVKIGKWLGAKKVLSGSIGRIEGKLSVTVKLIDIETSVTETSSSTIFGSFEKMSNQADVITSALYR
jgi:branched-chain amino acid transport system substrate-binding protein